VPSLVPKPRRGRVTWRLPRGAAGLTGSAWLAPWALSCGLWPLPSIQRRLGRGVRRAARRDAALLSQQPSACSLVLQPGFSAARSAKSSRLLALYAGPVSQDARASRGHAQRPRSRPPPAPEGKTPAALPTGRQSLTFWHRALCAIVPSARELCRRKQPAGLAGTSRRPSSAARPPWSPTTSTSSFEPFGMSTTHSSTTTTRLPAWSTRCCRTGRRSWRRQWGGCTRPPRGRQPSLWWKAS